MGFFLFYGRMIETEERLLDQVSIYILEIIQSKQVCLKSFNISVYDIKISFRFRFGPLIGAVFFGVSNLILHTQIQVRVCLQMNRAVLILVI